MRIDSSGNLLVGTTTGISGWKVTIGGTDYAAAATITAAGVYPQTAAATFAPTAANTGTTDDLVTFTATGTSSTGAVTVVIAYVVRNSNGASNPTASQQ
jgi:hypothetical protein